MEEMYAPVLSSSFTTPLSFFFQQPRHGTSICFRTPKASPARRGMANALSLTPHCDVRRLLSAHQPFLLDSKQRSSYAKRLSFILSHSRLAPPSISPAIISSREASFFFRVARTSLLYAVFIIASMVLSSRRLSQPAFAAPPPAHVQHSKAEKQRDPKGAQNRRGGTKAKGKETAVDSVKVSDDGKEPAYLPSPASTKKEEFQEEIKHMLQRMWERKILPLTVNVEDAAPLPIDEKTSKLIQAAKQDEVITRALEAEVDKAQKEVFQIIKENSGLETLSKEDIIKAYSFNNLRQQSYGTDKQVPKITCLDVALAWRQWRDKKKAEFKELLLNNPQLGQKYIEEEVLRARDRVVASTWYDDKNKRWEMQPAAVGYAVERDLVECARVRHDKGLMYLRLKGDDKEFYVNLPVIDVIFEKLGGVDALHKKMVVYGIPTIFEVMRVPFHEWDPVRLFFLPFKICYWSGSSMWESRLVSPIKARYFRILNGVAEELMIRFGFPVLEKLPKQATLAVGLQLGDRGAVAEITPIMEWKMKAQKNVELRYDESSSSTSWWISLPVRGFIVGLPLALLFKLISRILVFLFGPPEGLNVVELKEKIEKNLIKQVGSDEKEILDPVKKIFERMKRIKHPDVSLQDFAGLDSIKEEIKEIVTFLQNPSVFKKMGARPPRGVLITGQQGTGKTSLALAIAAEAKVPMVEIQALELEGGAWVGQGASNVRELFKIARDLAPLIIFIDDFDFFAGVRGETRDSRQQDHEALINQLLVELDGFETQEGVVLIATSSRPWTIDQALRRPGRMDRTIALPMPNVIEREVILKDAARKTMNLSHMEFIDWPEVARKTAGMTPQRLQLVPTALERSFLAGKFTDDEELISMFLLTCTVNKLMPGWVRRSKWIGTLKEKLIDWMDLCVTKSDIESAIGRIDVFGEAKPGMDIEAPPVIWTREFKYPHAVWAAGRGLTMMLLPNFDAVEQIWLDPSSWDGIGFTRISKRMEAGYEETGTITRSYYEKKLVACFGSYLASRLLLPFGEHNNLSSFEISEAEKIASSMVLEFGWGPDDSQAIYKSPSEDITVSLGEELEYKLIAKIEKVFNTGCQRALEILQRNRAPLHALLEYLLEYDSATTKDLWRILRENGAVLEEEPFTLFPHANGELVDSSTNGRSSAATLALSTGLTF